MKYSFCFDSPVGPLYIAQSGDFITDVLFRAVADSTPGTTPLILRAAEMLREYFDGRRRSFDLPLNPAGTPFQKKAWDALLEIPYGQTRTYKQQAAAAGNVRAVRAIGAANGKNPICIIIPCHRVIGADGTLTGYGGGIHIKRALLDLEQRNYRDKNR